MELNIENEFQSQIDQSSQNLKDNNKIEDLAFLIKQASLNNLPKPIIFMGAGASFSSGIPLTNKIVEDVKLSFREKPSIRRMIESKEMDYYKIMKELTADERRDLFYKYITNENVKINATNIYIAQLLKEKLIDFVLTVNFDDLILRACALFNFLPPVYDISNINVPTTSNFRENSVIYLHGQHFGQWLLNSENELSKIDTILPNIFNEIKNRRTWIIVGYSGNDEVFNQIKKLGSFTNNLYWINFFNNQPAEYVSDFINNPNTNAYFINGFDSDLFFLKLNGFLRLYPELKIEDNLIIDKPFTSLKNTLDKIADMTDSSHFKFYAERLQIAKENTEAARQIFEKTTVEFESDKQQNENDSAKSEPDLEQLENKSLEINSTKLKIIEFILNENINEEEITKIEKSVNSLNDNQLKIHFSLLLTNYGTKLAEHAELSKSVLLYENSFNQFKKAIDYNPNFASAHYNYGLSLAKLAEIKNDLNLYEKAQMEYEIAFQLDNKSYPALANMANVLKDISKINNDESIFLKSLEINKQAYELNPNDSFNLINWANSLAEIAEIKNSESIFQESFDKYELAQKLTPNNYGIYYGRANALFKLGVITKEEKYFSQAFENYKRASELNYTAAVFYFWGIALYTLTNFRKEESIFKESIEKFEKAASLNQKSFSIYFYWGKALYNFAKYIKVDGYFTSAFSKFKIAAKLRPSEKELYNTWGNAIYDFANSKHYLDKNKLFKESEEILKKGIELGAGYYNLSCLYSIWYKKDLALKNLVDAFKNKEIPTSHVLKDEDWKNYWLDEDFQSLIATWIEIELSEKN